VSELDVSDLVYREHQEWRKRRSRVARERERWSDADWIAARTLADAAWGAHQANLYVYDAERALREQHYWRTSARFAAEARLDVDWLLGVLEATR